MSPLSYFIGNKCLKNILMLLLRTWVHCIVGYSKLLLKKCCRFNEFNNLKTPNYKLSRFYGINTGSPLLARFSNNTIFWITWFILVLTFLHLVLNHSYGFLLTRLFFQSLKKQRKQRTPLYEMSRQVIFFAFFLCELIKLEKIINIYKLDNWKCQRVVKKFGKYFKLYFKKSKEKWLTLFIFSF
jgi:hypothetical protein